MFKDIEKLLEKNWDPRQREMVVKMIEGIKYYKKLIPKSLKHDIEEAIGMCLALKDEMETHKARVTAVEECAHCSSCRLCGATEQPPPLPPKDESTE